MVKNLKKKKLGAKTQKAKYWKEKNTMKKYTRGIQQGTSPQKVHLDEILPKRGTVKNASQNRPPGAPWFAKKVHNPCLETFAKDASALAYENSC